jgi:hypothetical protein
MDREALVEVVAEPFIRRGLPRHVALGFARAALAAIEGAGFAVVPREATPEMLARFWQTSPEVSEADRGVASAAVDILGRRSRSDATRFIIEDAARDYRAMIAAASPAQDGETGR